ncbi:MAG: protein translocase subunit SecF [Candidatus Nanopelagicales bacterium]|jgi:preprotein translocase subunit SecF|nr:protein translocase subunit SecF [Candidatus Nanopelagicales bacterium]
MSRFSDLGGKLYRGEVSYDIVGHRKLWYSVSAALILLALVGLLVRGLNLGIEFKGGAEFYVPSTSCTIQDARDAVGSAGVEVAAVTEIGSENIRAQTPTVTQEEGQAVVAALATACDVSADQISSRDVGPTWGGEITRTALIGLAVFLAALSVFLTIYFQWKMAVAALIALVHDIVITAGVYALVGFEVTPATVIGLLTILGFSLYDTVVVFDKVRENTKGITGQSRYTYSELANLALNQTIIRSINTSIVALLPVASILFVGAFLLGAGALKDLALVLLIGTAIGTYSSIFVATPALCQMKEREPAMKALTARVLKRRAARGEAGPAMAEVPSGTGGASAAEAAGGLAAPVDRKHRQNRDVSGRVQPKRSTRSKRRS